MFGILAKNLTGVATEQKSYGITATLPYSRTYGKLQILVYKTNAYNRTMSNISKLCELTRMFVKQQCDS